MEVGKRGKTDASPPAKSAADATGDGNLEGAPLRLFDICAGSPAGLRVGVGFVEEVIDAKVELHIVGDLPVGEYIHEINARINFDSARCKRPIDLADTFIFDTVDKFFFKRLESKCCTEVVERCVAQAFTLVNAILHLCVSIRSTKVHIAPPIVIGSFEFDAAQARIADIFGCRYIAGFDGIDIVLDVGMEEIELRADLITPSRTPS